MEFDHTTGIIQNINSAEGLLIIGGTGALQLPTGTTAQRPASAGTGALRINSTSGRLEVFNNSAWVNVGLGDVTSVALSLPSIFSVTGSPVTSAGTITATLVSQAASNVLAAPQGSAGAPGFRQLNLNDLSDVAVSSPALGQLLTYNGTKWANTAYAASAASAVLSSWTLVPSSNPARYTASFTHNLGTFSVVVSLYDTVTNQMIIPDSVQLTSANAVQVTISSNTRSIRIVVVANGYTVNTAGGTAGTIAVQDEGVAVTAPNTLNFVGGGVTASNAGAGIVNVTVPTAVLNAGGAPSLQEDVIGSRPAPGTAGRLFLATDTNVLYRDTGSTWVPITQGVIRTMSFVAASMDTPNSSDWVISAIAPAIPDPSFNSLVVRSFDQTTEQGAGMLITVPSNATQCTFTFKGRPQTAQAGSTVVQMRVYRRAFPNASATGAWGTAVDFANITVPNTANMVYATQTLSLAALGWTAGQLTLLEITRKTAGITGTNLPAAFLLAEVQLEFS